MHARSIVALLGVSLLSACRDAMESAAPDLPTAGTKPSFSTAGWSGPVGQLYDDKDNVVGVIWAPGSPAPAGYYRAGWQSTSGNIYRGKCLAGTQPGPAGPTTLHCQLWIATRESYPAGEKLCGLADCKWFFQDVQDPNPDRKRYGAERAELEFMIEEPVDATITGPAQPIAIVGSYTWTANPSGGDGTNYTYWWDYSADNANWTRVATTRSYTRTLSRNDPDFYLRMTIGSVGGTKAITLLVDLTQPLQDQLTATIQGPDSIDTDGSYSWTSVATGGVTPYSYLWEINYPSSGSSWSQIGSGSSVTQFISRSNGTFSLRSTVTSADGLQSAVATRQVGVLPPPTVTISGANPVRPFSACLYTALTAGGTAPYSYAWTADGIAVGDNSAYYRHSAGTAAFQLGVTVTDAGGGITTSSLFVAVDASAQECLDQ